MRVHIVRYRLFGIFLVKTIMYFRLVIHYFSGLLYFFILKSFVRSCCGGDNDTRGKSSS